MSFTGDFSPNEDVEAAPAHPVVFGIALSPLVIGVLLGLAGIGGAVYIFLNLLQPAWDEYQKLTGQVTEKQAQLQQQEQVKQQIVEATANLETEQKKRQDVLTLFASEASLNTILLDINSKIDDQNRTLPQTLKSKLAGCPPWVKTFKNELEKQAGDLVTTARLKKFVPDPKLSGIITDGSYGALVNGKLKRQVATVSFEGNFNQTQSILRTLERLQPLLVLRNVDFKLGDQTAAAKSLYDITGGVPKFLVNCQPDAKITTTVQMEALLPLTPEELAAANKPPEPKK